MGDRADLILLMTLKFVFAAVVFIEAADSMELNGDHYFPPDWVPSDWTLCFNTE